MVYSVRTVTVYTTLQQMESNSMNSEDSLSDKGQDEVPLVLAFSGVYGINSVRVMSIHRNEVWCLQACHPCCKAVLSPLPFKPSNLIHQLNQHHSLALGVGEIEL